MTSRIRLWSSTAASNNATPPHGAPEGGTLVNQLNDIARQIMAEVRAWWEVPGWIDLGHLPTYSSTTAFTVTGNQTATYEVGRRVRAINAALTTIYGTITASAYTTSTLVTVSWDSGTLDNTVAEVAVGAATISARWLTFGSLAGILTRSQLPSEALFQVGMTIAYFAPTAPTGWILAWGTIGSPSSAATNRAHIDTQLLYYYLWNNLPDAQAPVTGGRGASAVADYSANKPIALPDCRGRAIFGKDDMGGTAANRITASSEVAGTTLGAVGGNELMHQHTHGVTDGGHSHGQRQGSSPSVNSGAGGSSTLGNVVTSGSSSTVNQNVTDPASTGISIQNAGTGGSQNMPPFIIANAIIKL